MKGFLIDHLVLISILSRFFMYMSTMTIQSKSTLLCVPLFGADFDGDCVHIYYPLSLATKAEALKLFSVRNQLNSSHTGKVYLELRNDNLLAVKQMSSGTIVRKEFAS